MLEELTCLATSPPILWAIKTIGSCENLSCDFIDITLFPIPTCPVLLIAGEFDMLASRAWAKSRILKWLCADFDQSESYPKV